ncbi:predicted protein [Lichtheimia corymbifera JMRC:FSU:9682]|uniref:Uncharacterized protein n=1 Tax=Lichtheimia corymbifera JMRC:FSU:9682 TaxID=1263082 RepID=A0A068RHB8_9FUNG|nr:predicted protein [Lichtheimia corymbifera JMRC:FSU:9682]
MYALQAYRRYKKDPVMLIICSGTLSDDVANLLKSSDVLGCRRYPCEGWGAKCLIMTKESLSTLTASEKRQPFASFGLFLTQSVPFSELSSDDETTKMLQSLAVDHYMSLIGNEAHLIDFFKAVLDKQEIFYNKILALADDDDKPRLREAINDAQVEQRELKRKLDQLEDDGDDGDDDYNNAVDDSNGNAADDNTDDTVDDNNDVDDDRVADKKTLYKKGMEFVAKYKKARMDKGKKRMDWQACMAAGRKEGLLLNYKNTNTLKNQFAKFEGNGDE